MERLTCWLTDGVAGIASALEEKYTAEKVIDILALRLAAYEDTGLAPKEIKKRLCQWGPAFSPLPDYSITDVALRRWAEADKDGRAMILPCRAGDVAYEIEPLWLATICDKDAKCRSCKDFYEAEWEIPHVA